MNKSVSLRLPSWLIGVGVTAILLGLGSRLLPVFDIGGRLLQQFPTEDGYLLLTIARNMAMGLGMSTADGTIATNGIQPFTSFVWALGYWLVDGDKTQGVMIALLVQTMVSALTAWLIYRLGRKVLATWEYGKEASWLLAVAFFVSPHFMPHSMNCLETGFHLLAIACVANVFYETDDAAKTPWAWPKTLAVGVLLGWAFWVRIDAVFLIFAMCIAHMFRGLPFGLPHVIERFKRVLVFGSVSVLVASPWLISNYLRFGSIMPVSGQSQGMAPFANNFWYTPPAFLEYMMVAIPIPNALEQLRGVSVIALIAVIVMYGLVGLMYRRANHGQRTFILAGAIVTACVFVYYGLFFGAPHFIPRYLILSAPFHIFIPAVVILSLLHVKPSLKGAPAKLLVVAVMAAVIVLNVRIFKNGAPHQHFQVVQWVEEHVPDDVWVGAIQTGTLGYFHDRTINLDGKVNPDALQARMQEAYCPEVVTSETDCLMYYIAQHKLQYLADWNGGIEYWTEIEPLGDHFDVVVADPVKNLSVLMRRGAEPLQPVSIVPPEQYQR